jgi:hypothetical protein
VIRIAKLASEVHDKKTFVHIYCVIKLAHQRLSYLNMPKTLIFYPYYPLLRFYVGMFAT